MIYLTQFLKAWALVLASLLLLSCTNMPKPLATPTGRPDAVIEGNISDIKDIITNTALNWGYYVKNVSDYVAVYEKRDESLVSAMLLGSKYDATPVWRLTFNYASINGGVRVVANIHAVTNPGGAFEKITDFSTGSVGANNVQSALEHIRADFSLRKQVSKKGKVGIQLNKALDVIQVFENGPAEGAGIKVGDRVVEIDNVVPTDLKDAVLKITGEPGTRIQVKVLRNGLEQEMTITRGQP